MDDQEEPLPRRRRFDLSLFVSGLALLAALTGLAYQQYQNKLIEIQGELAIHDLLTERNSELLQVVVEYPDVRPYFYDGIAITAETDASLAARVRTMAEMWSDFFEQVLLQLEYLPDRMESTWKSYATDMHTNSPAIQEYFKSSCSWYLEELRELWGCSE